MRTWVPLTLISFSLVKQADVLWLRGGFPESLLVAIEKRFLDQGVHTSWPTLRQQLSTHQVVTIVLPASKGSVLKIRKGTTPSNSVS